MEGGEIHHYKYLIKVLGVDKWQYAHYIIMVVLLVAMLFLIWAVPNAVTIARKSKLRVGTVMVMAVLFVWSVISFSGVSTFLYFNF